MKVRVRCSFEVDIELDDDVDPWFCIEDNGCPGSGPVGTAVEEVIARGHEDGYCWACKRAGENVIVEIDGVAIAPDDPRHANG